MGTTSNGRVSSNLTPSCMNNKLKVIGLTEEEAIKSIKSLNMRHRVVCKDGIYAIVTRDHRVDRVNLYVEGGKVVKANLG